jgi:hypothetical protein
LLMHRDFGNVRLELRCAIIRNALAYFKLVKLQFMYNREVGWYSQTY